MPDLGQVATHKDLAATTGRRGIRESRPREMMHTRTRLRVSGQPSLALKSSFC